MISLREVEPTMPSSRKILKRKIDKRSVENSIRLIRGQRVMLDSDVAKPKREIGFHAREAAARSRIRRR